MLVLLVLLLSGEIVIGYLLWSILLALRSTATLVEPGPAAPAEQWEKGIENLMSYSVRGENGFGGEEP